MTTTRMRAPFRYWGAKGRMAPWIIEHLPPHNHFIEACAGSAAVMAVKEPVDTETVNDVYGEVTNFFRVLRDPRTAADLIDMVAFTPYSIEEFRHAGEVLEQGGGSDVLRAWAFLIRMQMAVVPGRSGWSYSLSGGRKANRPGRWATMPDLLRMTGERFRHVQVENRDVIDLIERYDAPGVCMFIDPPYMEEVRPKSIGRSSGYVHDDFDHGAMLRAIADSRHASFVVVHYPVPFYDEAGFTIAGDYDSHRNVPNGDGRDAQVERLYVLDRSCLPTDSTAAPQRLFL